MLSAPVAKWAEHFRPVDWERRITCSSATSREGHDPDVVDFWFDFSI